MFNQLTAELAAFGIIALFFVALSVIINLIQKNSPASNEDQDENNTETDLQNIETQQVDDTTEDKEQNNPSFAMKIFRILFPRINHDVWWHRLVSAITIVLFLLFLLLSALVDQIGVNPSEVTFSIMLVYYFIGQRIIYFVAYGKDKSKWQKNSHDAEEPSD